MKKWFAILLFAIIGHTASAQDLIVKCNAEEINAKVLSVSATDIEYRKFDNLDGPIYKLPVSDVFYIKYQNGSKDVFTAQTPIRRPRFTHHNEHYPYYQGGVAVAYGLGIGLVSNVFNTDRIALETVHGVRLCPYFFVGGGLAFNYFYKLGKDIKEAVLDDHTLSTTDVANGVGILPVFANAKGYYPLNGKCSIYLSLDLGAAIPITGLAKNDPTQFYSAIGPGINFGNGNNHSRGDFSIRFQHMGAGFNAMLFRIGLEF